MKVSLCFKAPHVTRPCRAKVGTFIYTSIGFAGAEIEAHVENDTALEKWLQYLSPSVQIHDRGIM